MYRAAFVALVLVCLSSSSGDAQTCPAVPTNLSPANGATVPRNVTLSWSEPNATGFKLYLEKDGEGCPTLPRATLAGNSFTPAVPLLPGTTYIWKVAALKAECPEKETVCQMFTTDCTTAVPQILSPPNGATNVSNPVTFSWSTVLGIREYFVFVSGNGVDFTGIGSTTESSLTWSAPNEGLFYWYVQAAFDNCPPKPSDVASFRLGSCNNELPELLEPQNGATNVSATVELSWRQVPGATLYRLWASFNGGPFGILGETGGDRLLKPIAPGTSVTWYVQAVSPGCPDRESLRRTFTTAACQSAAAVLGRPVADAQVSGEIEFSWSSVSNAKEYVLWIVPSGGAPQQFFRGNGTTHRLTLPPGLYEWYVETLFNDCPPSISERRRFTVAAQCSNLGPFLDAPPEGASLSSPVVEFLWNPVPGATGYSVIYSVDGGANVVAGSTVAETKLSATIPNGMISWLVEARIKDCSATFSPRRTFTMRGTCDTAAPALLSPPNGATGVRSPVELAWTGVSNAIEYRVFASIDGAAPRGIGVTPGTTFVGSFAAGTVTWWVDASFKDCPPVLSSRFTFTVATGVTCDNAVPSLISPADGATNVTSPVTLRWSTVSNAVLYRIWASPGGGTPTVIAVTPETSLTFPAPSGAIEWFIEAQFRDCPATFSKHATFTVATGSCPTTPPLLESPADGATGIKSPVEFEWAAVNGAIEYVLFLGVDGAELKPFAVTRGETEFVGLVPSGAIVWYVRAIVKDCVALDSAQRRFTVSGKISCSEAAPTLIAPADGATSVQTPATMSWTSVAGAEGYKVWLVEQGAPPIIIGATTTETTLTRPLPSGTHEWFVEAMFSDCPPRLSPRFKFTVSQSTNCAANGKPAPIAPVNNAQLAAGASIEFSWSAVTNAVAYKLWVSLNEGPPADLAVVPATQTNVRREFPGEIRKVTWFVEAIFGGCPPTESDRFRFTIAEGACTTAAVTVVSPSGTNVSSPVKFSWTSISEAMFYRVWLVPESRDPVLLVETPETSVERPIPAGAFDWYVEAFFRGCAPTRSDLAHFSVPQSSSCEDEKPTLLSPAQGATDLVPPIEFFWTPVSGAVGYQLWIIPEHGNPGMIGATESTTLERPFPPGKFEWFIRAFFNGCGEIDSTHFTFTVESDPVCEIPRPIPLLPPDGALSLLSPVEFVWTRVPGATGYRVLGSIDGSTATVIGTTSSIEKTSLLTSVPAGRIVWLVQAIVAGCEAILSKESQFTVTSTAPTCGTPETPLVRAPGEIPSGHPYPVFWTPVPNSKLFEIQEATQSDFSDALSLTVSTLFREYSHTVTAPTAYVYRVRALSDCNEERGAYSDVVRVVIVPPPAATSKEFGHSSPIGGTQTIQQQLFIPGSGSGKNAFAGAVTITTDKPWLTVTPSSVTVPPEGTTVTVTADPATLPFGTSTGTVSISGSSGKSVSGNTPSSVPVSVSLVSPVASTPKTGPPPNSLVIPAVAHAAGFNSQWESDIRVTNTSAQTIRYQLNFTQSGTDATKAGRQSTIEVAAGQTMALDDILKSFFGLGSTGESATGTLELRPINFVEDIRKGLATIGSSRTYNTTSIGTYGQFIPAIPFASFVGKNTVLSLQQIAQSDTYRTNFGLVEGSGEAADVLFSVFNTSGQKLKEFTKSLKPGEHAQYDRLLQTEGVSLTDGRVEVKVTSATGKVTAYASVVDNRTSDPLLVSPVAPGSVQATKLVVPGVADLTNALASWRTDMRVYNASSSSVTATLTFYPQGAVESPASTTVELAAGEVEVIDNALQTLFNKTNSGGAIHVTTATASAIVVTARTYNHQSDGTYGQFIPAISPSEATGLGGRPLQILQLEESPNFRTNLGLAEVNGAPATVEITAIVSDSTVASKKTESLAANEFKQITQILKTMGLGTTYNARIAVKVTSGSGKVTAYGSVIDNQTQDPTYVPSQ